MTDETSSASPLAELARAAKLPPPAERKRIREAAGVSLRRVAEQLDVSITAIWQWENGKDGPSLENAARYRALLDELSKAAS